MIVIRAPCDLPAPTVTPARRDKWRQPSYSPQPRTGDLHGRYQKQSSIDRHHLCGHVVAGGTHVRYDAPSEQSETTQGVTKDETVGIPLVDFEATRTCRLRLRDTEAISKVFVDNINKTGGIGGRKLVPVYKKYPPIPGGKPDPLSLCTCSPKTTGLRRARCLHRLHWPGQKCLTSEHNVIHIGHELDQPWIDDAPGGSCSRPTAPRRTQSAALISLLASSGKLKGKTVAVVGDKNNEARVNDVIVPALKKAKAKTGSSAILNITGTDTTAAQAQVDSFVEKWKTEGVDTVFLAGNHDRACRLAQCSIQRRADVGDHRDRRIAGPGEG
jgi:hypothetical protein